MVEVREETLLEISGLLKPFPSHGEKSFSNRGAFLWNRLPQDLRTTDSLPLFKMTFLDLITGRIFVQFARKKERKTG